MKYLHLFIGVIAVLGFAIPASAQDAPESVAAQAVPGEYIVLYKSAAKSASVSPAKFEVVQRMGMPDDVLAELQSDPNVVYAESNYTVQAQVTPNDTDYALQWFWYNADDMDVDANQAWDYETGDSGTVIAVIDSGTDLDHPDLNDNLWHNPGEIANNGVDDDGNGFVDDYYGWDFLDDDKNPTPQPNGGDDSGVPHGTHIAGLIAAETNNNQGVAGLGWHNRVMTLRTLNDLGSGSVSDIADAMYYAVDEGADVINLSLGTPQDTTTFKNAVEYAEAHGVVVVAAAGNNNDNLNTTPFYPACYSSVIGVAATTRSDTKASYSSYGSDCVSLSAPGTNLYSTYYTDDPTYGFTDDYDFLSGTSQATGIVSAIAGLMLANEPSLSASNVRSIVINTADNVGLGVSMGSGRANAKDAIAYVATTNVPSSVTSKNFGQGIKTTWTNTESNLSHFNVYRKEWRVDDTFKKISTSRVEGTSFIDENVTPGQEYWYKIEAVDNNGQKSDLSADGGKIKYYENPLLVVAPGPGGGPDVRLYSTPEKELKYQWNAYASNMTKGVEIAVGDVDGDGVDEIVTGTGEGAAPQVRVFEKNGAVISTFYAYDSGFRGGVRVAVGDVDKDGREEIITAPGPGMAPLIKQFESDGSEAYPSFMALDGKFKGGAFVEVLKFDETGNRDIAVSAGPGGGAQVTIHHARTSIVKANFFAYDENTFKGGIRVASANTDNEGTDELFTIPVEGHTHVQFFGREPGYVKRLNPGFYAQSTSFYGGGWIAGGDIGQNGEEDIIVGLGPGITNKVKVFDKSGTTELYSISPYGSFNGGISVGAGYF